MANGWYENAAHGSVVDPAEGSDEIQALQELEHALVTIPDPRGGKKTRNAIKWEMKGSLGAGWRQVSSRQEERRKNSQGKDPKTFQENSQGRDPSTPEGNSQGKDPRTFG